MQRIRARWTPTVILGLLGTAAFAQENIPHREIPGPRPRPGERANFSHLDQVVFTSDGTKMAAGAGANVIIWNVADGKKIVRLQLPEPQIYHRLCFMDGGKSLVWCGREDPMIRIFDVVTGRQLREFRQPNGGGRGKHFSSRFRTFSPEGKRVAFNGPSFFEGLDVLDVTTGKIIVRIKEQKDCRGCAFSPNGKQIAAHSASGGVHIWDTETGKLVRELRADDRFAGGAFKFATYSPDSKFLATGGHTRAALDVWNTDTGKLLCSLPTKGFFYSVAFAQDSQSVLCAEAGGQAYLYHLVAEK
jgi:WD40 repeat protein